MSRLRVLIFLTFIESFAAILAERGIYFYAHAYLEFSDWRNLWLSLTIGLGYISGAMLSHRMASLFGERKVLIGTILAECLINLALSVTHTSVPFFGLNFLLTVAIGMKWPVVESYVSAGLSPRAVSRVLGTFNMTWALAVPVSIITAGYLIDLSRPGLFYLGAGINVLAIFTCLLLERKPVHLTDDHPDRLPKAQESRYRALCKCARWNLVSSYTLMFVLAPLAPSIASRLGYTTALSGTILMSLMEVMRVAAFFCLQWRSGWHGRPSVMVIASLFVPTGFAMILFGPNLSTVLLGQVAFGFACGVVYYGAIYYAMVTHNASVNAGGLHEALIGAGFAIGPAIGLVGETLSLPLGGYVPGMLTALGPMVVVCVIGGIRPVMSLYRQHEADG